ncbi:MAG: Orn/Lys/Arg decarboxylase N-terminal domain-containing protein, partial [Victivallaceae bacterium]|nr:Orn/Lys/Arg decarboxylase N-terminal domain-containing protein [Victivallaceae bacterium]
MNEELERRKILIVEDEFFSTNAAMTGALDRVRDELENRGIEVVAAESIEDGIVRAATDMDFDAFAVAVNRTKSAEIKLQHLLHTILERRNRIPVFLLGDRAETCGALDEKIMELAGEFIWILEDSPAFIAGRMEGAVTRYRARLLPPLMRAVWDYNRTLHEYSYAAPGHQGGIGFTKSPAGKKFYDFYGENLMRTDTGIERSSIGSLLDHEGAFHTSEAYAAKVFGADSSYSVVVGTSGSNRTVMQSCLTGGDIAVCDRNCHKSIEQGLILTGALPVYCVPTRNSYGIIGPIPRREFTPEAIRKKIEASAFKGKKTTPAYAVVTNCTYDGLCYNAATVEADLAKSCDRIHFDEAWYAYARFNPIYKDHFAMRGDPAAHRGPTVFATHSTHKLLNALSQASYIHVRHGKRPIDFARFNQSYMLHATTSPLYAICVSNDISTAMMDEAGESLTREVIAEAVDFRQSLAKMQRTFDGQKSWFFTPWNATVVKDRASGKNYEFADAPPSLLIEQQHCWQLNPGESWH